MNNYLKELKIEELMKLYGSILTELNERNVIRTHNNPLGDYAEWLFANKYNLSLASSSTKGFDVVDVVNNIRYQVKSRRVLSNERIQLGVIRNYEEVEFDYLIAMIFNKEFMLGEMYKIPHEVIAEYGKFKRHQNGFVLILTDQLKNDSRVDRLI